MIWHDSSSARTGLVEDMEDITGLGAGGISGNTATYNQFTRWANQWNLRAIRAILNAQDGFDWDDTNYTTYPSGTFAGTTNRDYVFDPTLKMLKLKNVGVSYDGINYINARPIDTTDPDFANVKADPNIDRIFSQVVPRYDPTAGALDLYPKFTSDQVALGAKVYVEFWRDAAFQFAIDGSTDSIGPGFDSNLHPIVSKGASYEYAKLYKPDLVDTLQGDIFGVNTRYKQLPGLMNDLEDFYSDRSPQAKRIRPIVRSPR